MHLLLIGPSYQGQPQRFCPSHDPIGFVDVRRRDHDLNIRVSGQLGVDPIERRMHHRRRQPHHPRLHPLLTRDPAGRHTAAWLSVEVSDRHAAIVLRHMFERKGYRVSPKLSSGALVDGPERPLMAPPNP